MGSLAGPSHYTAQRGGLWWGRWHFHSSQCVCGNKRRGRGRRKARRALLSSVKVRTSGMFYTNRCCCWNANASTPREMKESKTLLLYPVLLKSGLDSGLQSHRGSQRPPESCSASSWTLPVIDAVSSEAGAGIHSNHTAQPQGSRLVPLEPDKETFPLLVVA